MEIVSGGSSVESEEFVAITLRMFACASYLDLMLIFGVAGCTVYRCFHTVLTILCHELRFDGFPKSEFQREALSKGFNSSRNPLSPLHDCIGALDGIFVRITKQRDSGHPAQF